MITANHSGTSSGNSLERAGSLSFRQLRLFEAIGDLRSVRQAAEACNLSQPAVTQALAKMEAQLDVPLVDRRASGSYLNEWGEIFHARVKRFFNQAQRAIVEIGAATNADNARAIMNRLTRSQLRMLVAVVEHGSFEQAGEVIAISPASLQRSARDLQGNLQVSLFYRTASGMIVGPAGIRFGQLARLAMHEIELGVMELDAAREGSETPVVIGAMPFGGSVLLASVLGDFLATHPQADVRVISENATEMTRALRTGAVDFAVGLLPEQTDPDFICEPLAQTPYVIVGRRSHPLTFAGKVTVSELMAHDWIIGTEGSSRRACFERIFAGTPGPRTQLATCGVPIIRHLLRDSDRLTLMTSYEVAAERDTMRALHFSRIEPAPSIGITRRADWMPTRLQSEFLDTIRRHVSAEPVRLPQAV
ncbi:LysR family transcriptional regulator [Novosphingobium sp. 9]|uniref:LysR family transcriptional regulator n=1 Tax=Novosphingobium sp. 9 TaxID=2025349 RepID=UPI0021B567BF|nr:LysR family transcriptional regulator [Novosphingobium sp. 9]